MARPVSPPMSAMHAGASRWRTTPTARTWSASARTCCCSPPREVGLGPARQAGPTPEAFGEGVVISPPDATDSRPGTFSPPARDFGILGGILEISPYFLRTCDDRQ